MFLRDETKTVSIRRMLLHPPGFYRCDTFGSAGANGPGAKDPQHLERTKNQESSLEQSCGTYAQLDEYLSRINAAEIFMTAAAAAVVTVVWNPLGGAMLLWSGG